MLFHRLSSVVYLVVLLAPFGLSASDPGQGEFFEKRIRPLLVEHCHSCHGQETSSPMGGLRLDSSKALLTGGGRGPAVAPGRPEESLLIRAVFFDDPDLKMPPAGRLSNQGIADLVQWVKSGAYFPESGSVSTQTDGGVDWEEARQFCLCNVSEACMLIIDAMNIMEYVEGLEIVDSMEEGIALFSS